MSLYGIVGWGEEGAAVESIQRRDQSCSLEQTEKGGEIGVC